MEKDPFGKEQAETRLKSHFANNKAFGAIPLDGGLVYQGHFMDPFGVEYHAFRVNVTGNAANISMWGVAVTHDAVTTVINQELHENMLNIAKRIDVDMNP